MRDRPMRVNKSESVDLEVWVERFRALSDSELIDALNHNGQPVCRVAANRIKDLTTLITSLESKQ